MHTSNPDAPTAKFHAMDEGTQEDWAIIGAAALNYYVGLPDRILTHLRLLDGDFGGFAVDRLTHSLQTATRAERAGRDDEYILCALLHDIGDTLGSYNHADVAAAVVKPFVSEANLWMVEKHAIFQGYYFFHYLGLDRDMRDQFRDHEFYDQTAEFCADFDQPAFDPAYDTQPLEHYEPLVSQLLSAPKRSIYMADDGRVHQTASAG
jgi:predicted HD phosphohydrolase